MMTQWKIRRGESEMPLQSIGELRSMAEGGHVAASDYVWNPMLEKWMYARDVAEIEAIFRAANQAAASVVVAHKKSEFSTNGCAAALALLLFGIFLSIVGMPTVGVILIAGGIIVGIVAAAMRG